MVDRMNKSQLIKRISKARHAAGLSVNAAAALVDCSKAATRGNSLAQSSWARIEAGQQNPTWDTLIAMAAAVGLSVAVSIPR